MYDSSLDFRVLKLDRVESICTITMDLIYGVIRAWGLDSHCFVLVRFYLAVVGYSRCVPLFWTSLALMEDWLLNRAIFEYRLWLLKIRLFLSLLLFHRLSNDSLAQIATHKGKPINGQSLLMSKTVTSLQKCEHTYLLLRILYDLLTFARALPDNICFLFYDFKPLTSSKTSLPLERTHWS